MARIALYIYIHISGSAVTSPVPISVYVPIYVFGHYKTSCQEILRSTSKYLIIFSSFL